VVVGRQGVDDDRAVSRERMNGTDAVAVPAPSSTVKSSHTSVSSLISGVGSPAMTSVL
jgi:hypothetical protein